MTRVSPEFGDPEQVVLPVSADVSFASNQFTKYKLGADNEILDEVKEDFKGPSLKEVVVEETNQLTEQHNRLSVRDLASKFDKNLSSAAKLSEEAKLREVPSLEGYVLLKKLRDALECLKGRLVGRNKEDVEKAISMVEALAVKLTQKEGELIQEKFEVKKLANFLKQASEDAKKLVNQEKSFACAEIESTRAVVQKIGEALDEQERTSQTSGKQEMEELIEEVRSAVHVLCRTVRSWELRTVRSCCFFFSSLGHSAEFLRMIFDELILWKYFKIKETTFLPSQVPLSHRIYYGCCSLSSPLVQCRTHDGVDR